MANGQKNWQYSWKNKWQNCQRKAAAVETACRQQYATVIWIGQLPSDKCRVTLMVTRYMAKRHAAETTIMQTWGSAVSTTNTPKLTVFV
jgi:hypothetical protein